MDTITSCNIKILFEPGYARRLFDSKGEVVPIITCRDKLERLFVKLCTAVRGPQEHLSCITSMATLDTIALELIA